MNSLILLDEIGSGTEPNEGAALAIAIMEAFYQKGSILLTTTHYGEIKRYSREHEDFMTAAMAFDSEKLTPKYQLLLGERGDSKAFWIAEKMSLNQQVIKQAQNYLISRNYETKKKRFKIEKLVVETKENDVTFHKGDRVLWIEKNKIGLVYEQMIGTPMVKIYLDQEMITLHQKKLKLEQKAQELYPDNYDLDSLFEEYSVRKKRRDLERGSKKAYKELCKESRKRNGKEKIN